MSVVVGTLLFLGSAIGFAAQLGLATSPVPVPLDASIISIN